MEDACAALEIEFKRINNDLELVGHRFEAEFRSCTNAPDIMAMYRRMQQAETKIAKLKQKSVGLAEMKTSFLQESVLGSLGKNEAALSRALFQCGCASAIPASVADKMELNKENAPAVATDKNSSRSSNKNNNKVPSSSSSSAGLPPPPTSASKKPAATAREATAMKSKKPTVSVTAPSSASKTGRRVEAATAAPAAAKSAVTTSCKPRGSTAPVPSRTTTTTTAATAAAAAVIEEAVADAGAACGAATPQLTEARFASLPETVRGRVKLSDVTTVYGKLVQYAKKFSVGPAITDGLRASNVGSGAKRKSVGGGGRRGSIGGCESGGAGGGKVGTFPQLAYTIKELTAGAPPAYIPFASATDVAAASTGNAKHAMKLSGKSGVNVLMSLKALGLITLEASAEAAHAHSTGNSGGTGLTRDTVRLVVTDELEEDLMAFQQQIVDAHKTRKAGSTPATQASNATPFADAVPAPAEV